MIKSLCIKTNNNKIINYLLNKLEYIDIDNLYLSKKKFKIYENIIIHYTGENYNSYSNILSEILTDTIINFYEKSILKNIINSNYFYFTDIEKKKILDICLTDLSEPQETAIKRNHIYLSVLNYIIDNKSLVLDGFVNFRIKNYFVFLDEIVDSSVNSFLIEKEYMEFINLLKVYVASKPNMTGMVHLVYYDNESILLNSNREIIPVQDNILNAKYLSDISFSSNDYCLNTLLTILPEKIFIHLIDDNDEFINTISLIFDNKVNICTDCDICKLFKHDKLYNCVPHKKISTPHISST